MVEQWIPNPTVRGSSPCRCAKLKQKENFMDVIRLKELQLQHETDVIGSMLVNGNMTEALIKDLTPNDFMFKQHGLIYKAMTKLQTFGKFNSQDLLQSEHIERGKVILNLMNDCIMCNIKIKCQWILDQSINRGA